MPNLLLSVLYPIFIRNQLQWCLRVQAMQCIPWTPRWNINELPCSTFYLCVTSVYWLLPIIDYCLLSEFPWTATPQSQDGFRCGLNTHALPCLLDSLQLTKVANRMTAPGRVIWVHTCRIRFQKVGDISGSEISEGQKAPGQQNRSA